MGVGFGVLKGGRRGAVARDCRVFAVVLLKLGLSVRPVGVRLGLVRVGWAGESTGCYPQQSWKHNL